MARTLKVCFKETGIELHLEEIPGKTVVLKGLENVLDGSKKRILFRSIHFTEIRAGILGMLIEKTLSPKIHGKANNPLRKHNSLVMHHKLHYNSEK